MFVILFFTFPKCAEKFAPSTTWYVRTVVRMFELAGDKVKPSVAQTLMQLIAEGKFHFLFQFLSNRFLAFLENILL